MTVFPDGSKERLHGHNYYLALTIELDSIEFESMVDFGPVKDALGQLCAEWKEHTLLAQHNPFFEILSDTDVEIEFLLCKKRYVLPRGDVLLLPIDNIAVEPLADLAATRLLETLGDHLNPKCVRAIEVSVEENPGQGATARRELH